MVVTATCAAAAPAPGPMLKLDDTGATRCIVGGEFTKECAGTSQDAESGRDARAPANADGHAGYRFTRLCTSGEAAGEGTCPAQPTIGTGRDQWGCTRDEVTGLTWEIKLTDGSIRDAHELVSMRNWGWGFPTVTDLARALDDVALCGRTGWDAPTFSELMSLVDYGTRDVHMIDERFFPHTPLHHAWGTPYPTRMLNEGTFQALDFATGRIEFFYPGDGRHARLLVRPAKLQEPEQRFVASADGTEITDRWTHLVWKRCRLGSTWTGSTCAGRATEFEWADALAAARAAGPPWRLANLKEALSLTDLADGAIDQVAFPRTLEIVLWTSTPWSRSARAAWKVFYYWSSEFEIDVAATGTKATVFLVRHR
jgi:hypothetical protein